MKLQLLFQVLFLTGSIWVLVINSANGEQRQGSSFANLTSANNIQQLPLLPVQSNKEIRQLSEIKLPLQSADQLVQSPTPSSPSVNEVIVVTSVKANATDKGVEIILETSKGQQLQVSNRNEGNNFIADIPNAQLRLPSGDGFIFNSQKAVTGISQITVANQDSNTIRVTVTGEAGAPVVELFDSDEGLILGFTPAASAAQVPQQTPQTQPTPQEQPPSQTQPPAQTDEPIELVVTGEQDEYSVPDATSATRTDTPIRDIPASIQVIPRQIIEEQQVTQLDEALRNVSGVSASNFAGVFTEFTVRGFNGVPILRDGFRQYDFFQVIPEPANLESIEVLKGPASILYGDIEPGGLINVVTKKPLSNPFYEAELQIGSNNFFRPRIDFSGPLTTDRNLLYRLNALYKTDDGFRGYDQPNERFFIAPTASWKISDRTDLTVSFDYTRDERPFDAGLFASGTGVVNVPRDRITNEPDDRSEQNLYNVGYSLEHRFSNKWKLRNAFRYLKQDYLSAFYFPVSFDEPTGDLGRVFITRDLNIQTYALQTNVVGEFSTGSIAHKLLFGVDLNRDTQDFFGQTGDISTINIFDPDYRATPRPNLRDVPVTSNSRTEVNRLGVYVQDQISLLDNLKLLAGLRYDTVEQTTKNKPTASNSTTSETEQNDDAFTPRLGIVYQPIKELSLYASYARSFTPNSGITRNGSSLEPEQGVGYEVGVKADLFEGKLSGTLAYFDITKQNVATQDPTFPDFAIASDEQRSRGVELDIVGTILPGWNIIAAYAYTDAEVTQDTNITDGDIVGNRLVNVPRNSASLWTTYTIEEGDLQGLGFGIGFNYVGNREGDLDNSFRLGSYFLTNAAIFYQQNNYRFAINVKNLFDVEYFGASGNSRTSQIEPGAPLTVIGSVSVQF